MPNAKGDTSYATKLPNSHNSTTSLNPRFHLHQTRLTHFLSSHQA